MRIGVLALQGNYAKHAEALQKRSVDALFIKKVKQLDAVDALVMPGGESTTMLKLMDSNFFDTLKNKITEGLPVFATCAGLILLASEVTNPNQKSLGVLDVTVCRNAYGSQVDSSILETVAWNEHGKRLLNELNLTGYSNDLLEIPLIRAPKITRLGKDVTPLIEDNQNILLAKYKNIIGATFHPELSESSESVYQLFFSIIKNSTNLKQSF
jgi:5'-phosphate synthase pdxT subunit